MYVDNMTINFNKHILPYNKILVIKKESIYMFEGEWRKEKA
jgi:hypothetical protein